MTQGGPVLKYPGAKWRMAAGIAASLPAHTTYLEPFSGGCLLTPMPRTTAFTRTENTSALHRTCLLVFEVGRRAFHRLAADCTLPLDTRLTNAARIAAEATEDAGFSFGYEGHAAIRANLRIRSRNRQMLRDQRRVAHLQSEPFQISFSQNTKGEVWIGCAKPGDLRLIVAVQPTLDFVIRIFAQKVRGVGASIGQGKCLRLIDPLLTLSTQPIREVNLPAASHKHRISRTPHNPCALAMRALTEQVRFLTAYRLGLLAYRLGTALVPGKRPADLLTGSFGKGLTAPPIVRAFHVGTGSAGGDTVPPQPLVDRHRIRGRIGTAPTFLTGKSASNVMIFKPVTLLIISHMSSIPQLQRKCMGILCEGAAT